MEEYVYGKSLPKPLTRWWLKTRNCKRATQINSGEIAPIVEFYVPWWAWGFELIHNVIFGLRKIKSK